MKDILKDFKIPKKLGLNDISAERVEGYIRQRPKQTALIVGAAILAGIAVAEREKIINFFPTLAQAVESIPTVAATWFGPYAYSNVNSGSYHGNVTISLAMNLAGTIYWNSTGEDPFTNGQVYGGPITLTAPATGSKTYTISLGGVDKQGNRTAVQTYNYTLSLVPPECTNTLTATLLPTCSNSSCHYNGYVQYTRTFSKKCPNCGTYNLAPYWKGGDQISCYHCDSDFCICGCEKCRPSRSQLIPCDGISKCNVYLCSGCGCGG